MEHTAKGERTTGTQDVHYNLISVLYHTLQGAETSMQYMADAEESGDEELARFFREVQDENRRRAERAKGLLAQRLSQGSRR
jgi:rubrerythrin